MPPWTSCAPPPCRLQVQKDVLRAVSDPDDLGPSQEVGAYLAEKGIQAVIFPSVVGDDANVVAFLDTAPPAKAAIDNRDEILAAIQKLADRKAK